MKDYFKNAKFDLECPKCKHKLSTSFQSVGGSITCPFCSQAITLQDSGFSNGVNQANKTLNQFTKDLKNIFK